MILYQPIGYGSKQLFAIGTRTEGELLQFPGFSRFQFEPFGIHHDLDGRVADIELTAETAAGCECENVIDCGRRSKRHQPI
jgi:hypothetical protein